ncbi:MAG: substrate-binding domain-containing protein [Planctomycetota bacterium]
MHARSSNRSRSGQVSPRLIIWPILLLITLAAVLFAGRQLMPAPKPKIAFITADSTAFWNEVVDGAKQAADQLDVELHVFQSDGTLETQERMLAEAMAMAPDGVAVSPVDAVRQTVTLSTIARATVLVTVDSDSPSSDRVCFVGADNYDAGRQCGQMVREALPEGGRVLIASGPFDKANGRERWRGLVDELLGARFSPSDDVSAADQEQIGEMFTIAPTLIDQIDPAQATAQIVEALQSGESFDAIVGLYGYHPVAIANAVTEAGGDADIKVIGFDAIPETRAAIADGRVFGVIAQDQFNYGYSSVNMLANIKRHGAAAALPIKRMVHLPPIPMTAETLDDAG